MSCLSELFNECRPQMPDLVTRLQCRLDRDQFRGRIDKDVLSVGANQRELAPGSGKQPKQIAIPGRVRFGYSWREIGIGWSHGRGIDHPLRRNNLLAFPGSVMGEQPPEPRIVA